jgi:hypothetical protein
VDYLVKEGADFNAISNFEPTMYEFLSSWLSGNISFEKLNESKREFEYEDGL